MVAAALCPGHLQLSSVRDGRGSLSMLDRSIFATSQTGFLCLYVCVCVSQLMMHQPSNLISGGGRSSLLVVVVGGVQTDLSAGGAFIMGKKNVA